MVEFRVKVWRWAVDREQGIAIEKEAKVAGDKEWLPWGRVSLTLKECTQLGLVLTEKGGQR